MIDRTNWVSEDAADTQPRAARMYDYLLNGGHNFAVDRELVDKTASDCSSPVSCPPRSGGPTRRDAERDALDDPILASVGVKL